MFHVIYELVFILKYMSTFEWGRIIFVSLKMRAVAAREGAPLTASTVMLVSRVRVPLNLHGIFRIISLFLFSQFDWAMLLMASS